MKQPAKKTPSRKRATQTSPAPIGRILSHEEIIAEIHAFGEELRADRQKAIAFLQRTGIITPTGKLAKPYR